MSLKSEDEEAYIRFIIFFFIHGKNDFAEASKIYLDLNNFVELSKMRTQTGVSVFS